MTHSTWKIVKRQVYTLDAQAAIAAGDEHVYLSTSCLHGRHDYCAATGRMVDDGAGMQLKDSATCKWCPAKCICECHEAAE